MGISDFIGGRGEAIAFVELTKYCRGGKSPYFWPRYLGEKGQTIDFLVELVDAGEKNPFFFAQVKTTQKQITKARARLLIDVPAEDVRRMAAYPAPTYVIGVQEVAKRAFIVSIHGDMRDRIRSITTAHELTCDTLGHLRDEVRAFWQAHDMTRDTSRFLN